MTGIAKLDFSTEGSFQFFYDLELLIERKIVNSDFDGFHGSFYDEIKKMGYFANDMPTHLLNYGRYFLTEEYYEDKYHRESNGEKINYVEALPYEVEVSSHAKHQLCYTVGLCLACIYPELKLYVGFAEYRYFHMWLFDEKQQKIIEPTPIKRSIYYGVEVEDIPRLVESDYAGLIRLAEDKDVEDKALRKLARRALKEIKYQPLFNS